MESGRAGEREGEDGRRWEMEMRRLSDRLIRLICTNINIRFLTFPSFLLSAATTHLVSPTQILPTSSARSRALHTPASSTQHLSCGCIEHGRLSSQPPQWPAPSAQMPVEQPPIPGPPSPTPPSTAVPALPPGRPSSPPVALPLPVEAVQSTVSLPIHSIPAEPNAQPPRQRSRSRSVTFCSLSSEPTKSILPRHTTPVPSISSTAVW